MASAVTSIKCRYPASLAIPKSRIFARLPLHAFAIRRPHDVVGFQVAVNPWDKYLRRKIGL